MKITYRGYDISVTREQCLGGWIQLYISIFRVSDGYCVEETFSDGEDTISDMMRYMKERVDAEIKEHGEGEWTYEDDK